MTPDPSPPPPECGPHNLFPPTDAEASTLTHSLTVVLVWVWWVSPSLGQWRFVRAGYCGRGGCRLCPVLPVPRAAPSLGGGGGGGVGSSGVWWSPFLGPCDSDGQAFSQCVVGCCLVVFCASGSLFFLFGAGGGLIGLGRLLVFLALLWCGELCFAVLCCAVLCFAVLRCAVLFCGLRCYAVLCPVLLCRAVPCRAVPCRALPCRAVPCPAVPCRAMPSLAVLCCAVLCCAVLSRAVLCCAVLCCAVLYCAVVCCIMVCCAAPCRAVLWCAFACPGLVVPPGPTWGGSGKGQTGGSAVWVVGAPGRLGLFG